jgi:hypothetical protein
MFSAAGGQTNDRSNRRRSFWVRRQNHLLLGLAFQNLIDN